MDIRCRMPELQEALKDGEAFQDVHLALGDFLIQREIKWDFKDGSMKIPPMLYPEIVVQLLEAEHPDLREQAWQAMSGLWKRQGLLGIPIAAGGHWTLLVFRRSGGGGG